MKKLIITLTIGLLFSSLNSFSQHGVGSQWAPEVILPNPNNGTTIRGFLYSNIATFSNNKRVVFLNKTDSLAGIYYTWSYDGVNWATPLPFSPVNVVGLHSPKIVSDNNNKLHIVWSSQLPKALFYTQMDSALNIVIDSSRISSNPNYNSYNGVYITTDLQSRIHVMWHEGDIKTDGDITETFYSRSIDNGNTWQAKQQLSLNEGRKSAFPRGQYNAYAGDTLAICWRDSVSAQDWDIKMVRSFDGGVTWSNQPTTIDSNTNFQGDPDLVIDPQGRFHLFYHDNPNPPMNSLFAIRVVYGYSDDLGVTWSPSGNFFNNQVSLNQRSYLVEGSRYDIQNNILWTFWKEEDLPGLKGGDMMCTYSLDRGVSWSAPEYITDHDSTSIGFKAVALLNNGALAVNYESPKTPNVGEMRVVYRERNPIITAIKEQGAFLANIYPNPASDKININNLINNSIINIYDNIGRLVKSLVTKNTKEVISTKGFPTGIYFIKIRNNDEIETKKLIIEHY